MAAQRIYTIQNKDQSVTRLVRATRKGPALAHVAATLFTARQATQNDLEKYLKTTPIEEAGEVPAAVGEESKG
jgi:hypothetical protein